MSKYQKPAELYDGIRLHQNENTGGCSPKVIEALAALQPEQIAFYPPYEAATRACAEYIGVDPDRLTLLNGLDEGITAAAIGYLRPSPDGFVPEAIIPDPAFEIFAIDTEVVGGKVVRVAPNPDFSFPLDRVLAAVTPNTRVVFVTNPNNPTGVGVPLDAIGAVSERVPRGGIVFVDEAYFEFSGKTFIPRLFQYPNVVVGRTFSKAFGLAGLRLGTITGHPDALEPIRLAVPVYSVNVAVITVVSAALDDRDHLRRYLEQVTESKALLYAACERLGVKYWPSEANFVLVCPGPHLDAVLRVAAEHHIYVRDRSTEPGCAGCLRVATGVVEHTRRFVRVLEEALCAEP